MPLNPSKSAEARSENIAELIDAGHDPKQAEAIAYRVQRGDAGMTPYPQPSTSVDAVIGLTEGKQ